MPIIKIQQIKNQIKRSFNIQFPYPNLPQMSAHQVQQPMSQDYQQNQGMDPRNYQQQQQQNESQNDEDRKDYKQVLVKMSDLEPEDECTIISVANAAIEEIADMTNVFQTQKYSKIAAIIKRELDLKLDHGWYVIVGKNFGTYVTHQKGSFMHFTFEDLHLCVFKAT